MEGLLNGTGAVTRYMLAGNARFTLVSKKTGARFTYRLRQVEDKPTQFFLSVLTGADNESDYSYAGMVTIPPRRVEDAFRPTRASAVSPEAPSVKAFRWFLQTLLFSGEEGAERFFSQAEVWHTGRCGRCGRALTVPESVAAGIGPECAQK